MLIRNDNSIIQDDEKLKVSQASPMRRKYHIGTRSDSWINGAQGKWLIHGSIGSFSVAGG